MVYVGGYGEQKVKGLTSLTNWYVIRVMVSKVLRIIISHLELFQGVMVIKGLRVNLFDKLVYHTELW